MKTYSLKSRLLKSISRPLILYVVIIGFLAFLCARYEINEVYDSQLITSTNVLWHLAQDEIRDYDEEKKEKDFDITDSKLSQGDKEAFNEYSKRRMFRLWKNNKMFIFSDNSIPSSYEPFKSGFSDFSYDGENWKIYSFHIPEQDVIVEVAEQYKARNEVIFNISLGLILPFLLTLPIIIYFLRKSLAKGLGDVRKISAEVGRRSSNDLTALKFQEIPSDLIPLTDSINDLLEKIKDTLTLEREFIDNAAHSLKTPIAGLKVQLQLLKKLKDETEKQELLEAFSISLERTSRLIEHLLITSKIENSSYDFERVYLNESLINSIRLIESLAQTKSIKIISEMCGDDIYVNANAELLLILFINILENSVKFSPLEGEITIKLSKKDKIAQIEIIDQGEGIKEDEKEKIFDRLYKSNIKSGNGLGLPIAKQIAELVGGNISADNLKTPNGFIVKINLPVL